MPRTCSILREPKDHSAKPIRPSVDVVYGICRGLPNAYTPDHHPAGGGPVLPLPVVNLAHWLTVIPLW